MSGGYRALDDDAQAETLRPAALDAAAAFGLEVARAEIVAHAYNTTFSVETRTGERVAIRVHTNSPASAAEITAQQEWQLALASEASVNVPRPLRTSGGAFVVHVPVAALGRDVFVSAATWLDGDDVGALDDESAWELGRTMALMHDHAARWRPTRGELRPLSDPLGGLALDTSHPELPVEDRAVLQRGLEAATTALRAVLSQGPLRPIHADLHAGNLKRSEHGLGVLDFDDSGLATPVLDLANATFYLRGGRVTSPAAATPASAAAVEDASASDAPARGSHLETALRDGYASVSPLPSFDPEAFEALLVGRQLLLTAALDDSTTASLRDLATAYRRTTVRRLRHWERTGRFELLPIAAS